MPHSPRVTPEGIYLLDSGRGMLARVDPKSGDRTDIAFCPGFLRGRQAPESGRRNPVEAGA